MSEPTSIVILKFSNENQGMERMTMNEWEKMITNSLLVLVSSLSFSTVLAG